MLPRGQPATPKVVLGVPLRLQMVTVQYELLQEFDLGLRPVRHFRDGLFELRDDFASWPAALAHKISLEADEGRRLHPQRPNHVELTERRLRLFELVEIENQPQAV